MSNEQNRDLSKGALFENGNEQSVEFQCERLHRWSHIAA